MIDDFRAATIWRGRGKPSIGSRKQDKGFAAQFDLIRAVIAGEAEPPAPESYLLSTHGDACRPLERSRLASASGWSSGRRPSAKGRALAE